MLVQGVRQEVHPEPEVYRLSGGGSPNRNQDILLRGERQRGGEHTGNEQGERGAMD